MTTSPADSYINAALRRVGVPNLWLEDALADVRLALWQQRDSEASENTIIGWACVDAARRYGPRTRSGNDRRTASLDELHEVGFDPAVVERAPHIDERRALNALTVDERAVLERRLAIGPHSPVGTRTSTQDEHQLYVARKILRLVLAGELIAPDRPYKHRRRCPCGGTFWTDRVTKRYCDKRCRCRYSARRVRRRTRPRRSCETCGAELTASRLSSLTRKRFCTQACCKRHARRPSLAA